MTPPVRVMEGFAGGGTLVAALTGNPTFQLVAGIEIAPDFTDEWQAQLVATLAKPFTLQVPHNRCGPPRRPSSTRRTRHKTAPTRSASCGPSSVCAHNAWPRAAGQGFAFTEIAVNELRVPRFLIATARSPRGLACKRLSACDRCGRPRLNAFTATRCLPSTTQRPCRYWGRGCRRGCFVRCFASWPITFYM